ncbi:outer membrane lipoprotein-sorting protein [Motiliproteus sp. MSK22-1]|uniref:outer membrane lipoprotein-sorting protein n=1 Tax=Motiliproteus sp. MSK22-1 TaxID=1897630 RepID=UPI000977A465|nr:outer membrane lipoprotein-sorting protein [Motiliproteus sp. MSK22-1]OMH25911.1 outer membrane lipoprotein-sorting protein [Motiliproteus sp. MSK22-1]
MKLSNICAIKQGLTLASLSVLIGMSTIAPVAFSSTPEERGLEIVQESDRRDTGWESSEADMVMILRNKQGDESIRSIRSKALEMENDGDKGLTIFDKPLDVKGTAFLTFSHATEPDDQWLFLPALKRVKRISSKNKSGPFMGSEFAFEDMSSFEVEKYSYKYLRDETIDGIDCYVVESFPKDKNSGYTRLITWFDKEEYRAQKIEYYDRKNSLLKTLRFTEYHQYLGKFWRPENMYMENHQTGKSTHLIWSNYQLKTGMSDRDFNKNSLKRAK